MPETIHWSLTSTPKWPESIFGRIVAWLKRGGIDKWRQQIATELDDFGQNAIIPVLRRHMEPHDVTATLSASFYPEVSIDGETVRMSVASGAGYLVPFLFGTRPGYWPPRSKIESWVLARFGGGASEREFQAMVWGVLRKIHEEGTPEHPIDIAAYDDLETSGAFDRLEERIGTHLVTGWGLS